MNASRWKAAAIILAWITATLLATEFDRAIATWADAHQVPAFLKSTHLAFILKLPGEFFVTVAVAVMVVIRKRPPAIANGLFVIAGGAASALNGVVKWIVGRARPFRTLGVKEAVDLRPFEFKPMFGGLHGLFSGTPNLAFPSGHATLAFASAATLAILFPKYRWIFYALAALTAAERFLETAHYFSDNVAAAALGISVVHLIARIWARPFQLPLGRQSSTFVDAPLG